MKIILFILFFLPLAFVYSCRKESAPVPESEYICWTEDYTVSTDTSIYYDGLFRFRIGNNWTYQRTNLQLDSNNIDTVTMRISEIRNSRGKRYWYGYFGWLRADGMDIYTTEYCYSGPECDGCATERPFFNSVVPSGFSLSWHWNSPSYSYTYKTDTIETISGNYPNYYKVVLAGPIYHHWYFVENIGVVKYIRNPGYSYEYDLISYSIQ